MRAAIQLLFILFYLGSSYVTTQHRLSHIVHKLEHSNSRTRDVSLESCKEGMRYTHFREAKKVGLEFHPGADATPRVAAIVSNGHFLPQPTSTKSQFEGETSHSRAPPRQASASI